MKQYYFSKLAILAAILLGLNVNSFALCIPGTISGNNPVCQGSSITLTESVPSGTWSSANTSVATVDPSLGNVYGVASGTAIISYEVPGGGCYATATVTVNATPNVNSVANQSVCNGFGTVPVNFSGSVAGTNYSWTNSNGTIGIGVSGSGNIGSFTTSNSGATSVSGIFTVTPSTASCTGAAQTFTVTVKPTPGMTSPSNVAVCNGSASSAVTFSGTVTGEIYSWSNSNTSIGLGGFGVNTVPSFTGINSGSTPLSGIVSVTPIAGGCDGAVQTFTVTVNPTPGMFTPSSQAQCNAAPSAAVSFSSAYSGASYTWTNNNTSVGLGASGSGNIAPFITLNSGSTASTATVTVTPWVSSCEGTPQQFAITVYPTPTVNTVANQYVCNGANSTQINFSGAVSNTEYLWSNSNTATGLAASGIDSISSFVATNTGTRLISGTVSVTPIANGCTGSPISFTVAAKATPNVNVPLSQAVCNGTTTAAVTFSGAERGTSYSWVSSGSSVGLANSGTGTVAAFVASTTDTVNDTATITVTPEAHGCIGSSETATIVVYPMPTVNVPSNQTICNGAVSAPVNFSGALSSATYSWTNSNTGTGLTAAGTGNIASFTATNSGATPTVSTIFVTPTANGCNGATQSFTDTVNPSPVMETVSPGGSYCSGGTGVDINLSNSESTANYQLFLGSATADTAVTGTGGSLDFGYFTAAGAYTVQATYIATGCSSNQNGSAVITINPLPTPYIFSSGGGYCIGGSGVDISLDSSDAGTTYQLNNGLPYGSAITSAGGVVDFGIVAAANTYSVIATNGFSCSVTLPGSATVVINPLPTVYSVTGGGAYCSGSAGAVVDLSSSETGVSYQLYHHSAPVGGAVAGTGSLIGFSPVTDIFGGYTVVATNVTTGCTNNMSGSAHVNAIAIPSVYSIIGGGSYCSGGAGVPVGLTGSNGAIVYRLYNGIALVDTMVGTGSSVNFGLQTLPGSYSVVAVNNSTGCTNNMTGSAAVTVNPLPAVFTTLGGGSYCADGSGVDISLNASTSDVVYQLYDWSTPIGSPLTGVGGALDFGLQTDTGTYYIVGYNTTTTCMSTMSGDPVVSINPLPVVYTVIGGGSYCSGTGGVPVTLDGSDAGITYRLYDGSVLLDSMAGDGSGLAYGLQTFAGSYSVVAVNTATNCTNNMFGAATINIISLPASHSVTGGGSYCAGGVGVAVGLDGSTTGDIYQLYLAGAPVATAVGGTGTAVSFGLDTAAGSYTVIATDTTTHCVAAMNDTAHVVVNPLLTPSVSINLSTADTICAGTSVTFSAASVVGGTAPAYQWTVNGFNVGPNSNSYTYIPGDGDMIGITVLSSYACVTNDTATASVGINVWPNAMPAITIAPDMNTLCMGSTVNFTLTDTFQGPTPSYVWEVNSVASGFGTSFSYVPSNGDIVYCALSSDYLCRTSTIVPSNNVLLTVDTPVAPIVSINAYPGTSISKGQSDTLVAVVVNGGSDPLYQWYNGTTAIPGATSATHISTYATGSDSISCRVTRNDACMLSSFNGLILMVNDLGVATVSNNSSISLYPNPNSGTFTVKGNTGIVADEDVSVDVTDMVGQSVYKGLIHSNNGAINELITMGSIASGNYILTLHSDHVNTVMHFVIEK